MEGPVALPASQTSPPAWQDTSCPAPLVIFTQMRPVPCKLTYQETVVAAVSASTIREISIQVQLLASARPLKQPLSFGIWRVLPLTRIAGYGAAPYLCRLVLCAHHPGCSHQWPLKACGWLMLAQQVKAVQPPVQRLCHDNGSHADISMHLRNERKFIIGFIVADLSLAEPCNPLEILLMKTREEKNSYQVAIIVEEAHSLGNMKEPHSNVFLPAPEANSLDERMRVQQAKRLL